VIRSNTHH